MSDGDGDDRASRLRNRRNKTREKAKSDTPAEQSKPSNTDKTDNTEKTSVKDDRPAQMMYLPESLQKEMNRQFGLLETEFEYEFDEDFEKNRHYFPLLVKAGLDSLDGLDMQEVKEKIDEFDE